jgi:hypothetical protein
VFSFTFVVKVDMDDVRVDDCNTELEISVPFHNFYRRFFGDTKGWFRLVEETEAVASGSAVLNLVKGGLPGSSTMELFAGKTKLSSTGVSRWRSFLEEAGYRLDHVNEDPDRSTFVFFFEKLYLTVQFVVTDCEPVRFILEHAWSTHLMNVLTLDGLYCPFPRKTLEHSKMVILRATDDDEHEMLCLFAASGYSKLPLPVGRLGSELRGWRSLGDNRTEVFQSLLGQRLYGEQYKESLDRLQSVRFRICLSGVKVEGARHEHDVSS